MRGGVPTLTSITRRIGAHPGARQHQPSWPLGRAARCPATRHLGRTSTRPCPGLGRRANVAPRKRDLNTCITFVCEAAAEKSGLSAAYHAGVPESIFRSWQLDRNLLYWSRDEFGKAIQERMALDGYRLEGPRNKDLLAALVDAAELGLELYRAAALTQGIVPHC